MGQPKSLFSILTFLLATSAVSPVFAQEQGSADRATARTLAQEGYEALRDKQYSVAAERFTRALGIVRAPTLLRDLARAQVGLGRLVDAHENYSAIIREGVASDAPAPWVKALADAKAEIGDVEKRLAWMTITVDGPAHPRVTIDGAPIPESSLGVKRPADPGRHEIRSIAAGYYTAKKVITLRDGESVKIAFELEDAPPDAKPKDEEETGKVSVANIVDPPWRKPLTIGTLAFGGASLAVGGVTGILAMAKRNELVTRCDRKSVCGPSQEGRLKNYHTLATVSTIGFVAGGVSAAAGVVLLLVRPQVLVQKPPTDQRDAKRAAFRWVPYITGDSVGVQGSF